VIPQRNNSIFLKAFDNLWNLEEAIKIVDERKLMDSKLSILGKLILNEPNSVKIDSEEVIKMNLYSKKILGSSTNFGIFSNPDFGVIFSAGFLTEIFLHKINKKLLGELTTGPYGVLRGVGAHATQTTRYLKSLRNDNYLLILRGVDFELVELEELLEKFYISD
jgi:hypothetical protein